jgi:segregation and condensation protein B
VKPEIDVQIEAVLFYRTEPVAKKELGSFLATSPEKVETALHTLNARLARGATRIIDTGETIQLVSAPEVATIVETLRKEDLTREIGKAGAETLAVVLYRGPVSRAQIDFIRGVNSSFILRNLQIRGLVERVEHTTHAHPFQYAATPTLYAHLGVTQKQGLPEYASIMNEIDAFEREGRGDTKEENAESDIVIE